MIEDTTGEAEDPPDQGVAEDLEEDPTSTNQIMEQPIWNTNSVPRPTARPNMQAMIPLGKRSFARSRSNQDVAQNWCNP